MTAALAHRGPDSSGTECIGPCILSNTRLAIIDLSERGHQPMSNEDRSVWITYNGEIYNAAELRQALAQKGYAFRSTTDTEVLLRLYEEYGEEAIHRLRGMFAFAIWDDRTRKLVLGRDRLGIKPLYYAQPEGRIVFASELKALLASGLVSRNLDPNGLRGFLQLGHVPPPWTAFEHVKPLPPGHLGIWKDGQFRLTKYWSLEPGVYAKTKAAPAEITAQLRERLLEAMRLHLVSDVPVALFLSGGIDSACLAALARAAGATNLTAATLGFEAEEYDEIPMSVSTVQALGLPHRVLRLPAKLLEKHLDHALWAMDQPTMDGMNAYVISRTVADAGFKVALTGQGADELFGGYQSLEVFRRLTNLARLRPLLPARALAGLLESSHLPYRWQKLSYLLEIQDPFLAAQLAVKVLYPATRVDQLLGPTVVNGDAGFRVDKYLAEFTQAAGEENFRERVGYLDIVTHLQPRLLRDMDAMSMAHSLEVRPVYLDHKLVEFMLTVPSEMRLNKKRLLLAAMKGLLPAPLHADLAARQKRTFTFPFEKWMGGELRPMIERTLSSERVRKIEVLNPAAVNRVWQQYCQSPTGVGWPRAWSLYVLQRWCEITGAGNRQSVPRAVAAGGKLP